MNGRVDLDRQNTVDGGLEDGSVRVEEWLL